MANDTSETQAILPVRANDGDLTLALIDSMNAATEEPDAPEWASRVVRELSDRGFIFARAAITETQERDAARHRISHSLPGDVGRLEQALRDVNDRVASYGSEALGRTINDIVTAALTPSARSGDNSQSSRVDTVQIGLIYGAAVCAVEEAASLPIGEPVALLHENPETGDVEVELFRHGAACLTEADRAAGWTETELYALTTPPTPDRIGKDAVREALEDAFCAGWDARHDGQNYYESRDNYVTRALSATPAQEGTDAAA